MDPTSFATLASSVVAILSPFLAKAADIVVPKAAEDLYIAIKARFSRKPAGQEALADLERTPTDADVQAAMRLHLSKLLAEDKAFVAEVQALLKIVEDTGFKPAVSATDRGVAAGRDVGGTVLTGDIQGSVTIGRPDEEGRP